MAILAMRPRGILPLVIAESRAETALRRMGETPMPQKNVTFPDGA